MIKVLIPLAMVAFALGCHGETSTAPDDLTPNLGVHGSDGGGQCAAVTGGIHQVSGVGTIDGDLEGTIESVGGFPIIVHGEAVFRPVVQTWEITGGVVEPLVGRTLVFENEFVGITAKLPLVRVNTRARLVAGAERGNLTLHGTTDVRRPITIDLEYHGVICP